MMYTIPAIAATTFPIERLPLRRVEKKFERFLKTDNANMNDGDFIYSPLQIMSDQSLAVLSRAQEGLDIEAEIEADSEDVAENFLTDDRRRKTGSYFDRRRAEEEEYLEEQTSFEGW